LKFNLTLIDGTQLNDIILSTTHDDMSIGELHDEEDFYSWIRSNKNPSSKIMYFCGRYVQGGISHPKVVKSYEILDDENNCCLTLICDKCGTVYHYIPKECKHCGNVFIDD
jgi:hypothetical protein